MVKIAEDYGGTVEKNTGDGLMVYFEDGRGTPPECGVKRAVSCALSMMDAAENLINPVLLRSGLQGNRVRLELLRCSSRPATW